jgi:hypothetical protein
VLSTLLAALAWSALGRLAAGLLDPLGHLPLGLVLDRLRLPPQPLGRGAPQLGLVLAALSLSLLGPLLGLLGALLGLAQGLGALLALGS